MCKVQHEVCSMNCAVFILMSTGRKQWSVWPVAGPSPRRGWVYCAVYTVQWDFGKMKHPVILSHCAESLKLESLSTEFWREKIYLLGNIFPFQNIHLYTFTQVHILTCAHVHMCTSAPVLLYISRCLRLSNYGSAELPQSAWSWLNRGQWRRVQV